MSVKYHGKYCGPGWSAGKYQQSVKSRVPPVDDFDATCKEHDGAYAHPTNSKARNAADDKFFRQNIGGGPKRAIAALAVKAASKIMRAQENNPSGIKFRGSRKPPKKRSAVSRARARLDQRSRLTQNGHLINSITNIKLIEDNIPTPTMKRSNKNTQNKYKANNTTTKAPVATSKTVRISKPRMSANRGETMITHREYIGPVTASSTTAFTTNNVNPGLQSTFPWLSSIANGYERYKFSKIEFTFVSAAATSERGRVALAFQYDPTSDDPVSRSGLFSIVPNVEEAPWEDIVLKVKPLNEYRYVRQAVPASGTYNTYDCGKVHVMTAMNADSTTQLGELFVEYTVLLMNPQFQNAMVQSEATIGSESATVPFGTSITASSGVLTLAWKTGLQLTLGTSLPLLIALTFVGTGLAQSDPTLTKGVSTSQGAISVKSNTVNAGGTYQIILFTTKYTNALDAITVVGGESTTVTTSILRIALYTEQ